MGNSRAAETPAARQILRLIKVDGVLGVSMHHGAMPTRAAPADQVDTDSSADQSQV
jgi:hypothetical protein